jgi:hypothetical protein
LTITLPAKNLRDIRSQTVRVTTLFSMRGFAVFACIAFAAPTANAQQAPAEQPQKEHVVRKGDTLWDLARSYLNDPFRWPMIYDANRRIVENPNRIFPRETLVIPGLTAEQPVKVLGEPVEVPVAPQAVEEPEVEPQPEPEPEPEPSDNRSRFYVAPSQEPAAPTVISSERQRAAIVQPMEYVSAPWIADSATIGINGRVIGPTDPRTASDKLVHAFHPHDELYVSTRAQVGERLLVVRLTRSLRPYGWVVKPMGIVRVDSVGARAARGRITQQFADLKAGDFTIPLPPIPALPTAEPTEVAGGPSGRIIDFLDPQPLYGTADIGFINLGSSRGLKIGDEVVAFLPERRPGKNSPVVPAEPVAEMRIIKVTNNTATVRITRMHNSSLNSSMPVRLSKQTR